MNIKSSKEIKSLVRRLVTYNSWRLGDKPFLDRGEMYTPEDVNELFDDVIEGLEAFSQMVAQLTEFPSTFSVVKNADGTVSNCACGSQKKTVKSAAERASEKAGMSVSNPNPNSFIQS